MSQYDIPESELFHHLDDIVEIKLSVPARPTLFDLAVTYRKKLQRELELAEEQVFERELDLANSQRIAMAAHAKVATLQAQLAEFDRQIDQVSPLRP